ncbi:DEAD/DEAH box helicase [Plastoroseomonas arctica]|uniref:DEAD/DEAH box helicase n=1 Tax=Plastoroseomonas arctica TaxID=1509237 RepID=A0AAF1K388_9PROT|nr:DEAD/DEAH box helicase [Plastoroseomonas arctica]MBR0654950.1 DEAD/DEAH box helicase [Plastoroseomonas arctica]
MAEHLDRAVFDHIRSGAVMAEFMPSVRDAGRAYAAEGRVLSRRISSGGWVIDAETAGTAKRPYAQNIVFSRGPRHKLVLEGICTCPVNFNCKHVAAVLIAMQGGLAARPSTPAAVPDGRLPSDVALWLDSLDAGVAAEAASRVEGTQLRYILDIVPSFRGGMALHAVATVCRIRKDGTAGQPRPFNVRTVELPMAHVGAGDRLILRRLGRLSDDSRGLAEDDDPAGLLRQILATGRAHWQDVAGPQLREGPPCAAAIAWEVATDGSQRAGLPLDPPLVGLSLPMPWYFDPASATFGPVEAGLPDAMVRTLLAAPPIPAAHVERVAAELARRLPGAPPPFAPGAAEDVEAPASPRLRLTRASLPFDPAAAAADPLFKTAPRVTETPAARLSFGYGPVVVPPGSPLGVATVTQGGRLYRVTREREAERAAMLRLDALGLVDVAAIIPGHLGREVPGTYILDPDNAGADWFDIVTAGVEALREEGWQVEVATDFPLRIVLPDSDVDARLQEGQGTGAIDWFDLELGVIVDGKRLDLVPLLLRMIEGGRGVSLVEHHDDDEPFLIPLDDGRLLTLPMARLRPILMALAHFHAGGGTQGGKVRFTRRDAAEAAALEEATGLAWSGGEQIRTLGRILAQAGGRVPPVALPEAFLGALRPYQAEGVAWLQFLREAGFGGILADDMGLGKTVQTLAHLAIEKQAGRLDRPALIICPTSLIPNWTREAARFAPHLKLLALHGPTRREHFASIDQHDLVLTTYPLLARDHEALVPQPWHMVVLDEAQIIKNPKAEATRAAMRLKARQRICLSGTPLQNHLGELWSLFDFLTPGFLGAERDFRARYRTPIEKHADAERQVALTRRVRPFLLRRTKAEVASDLPPRTDIVEPVEMEAPQRAIYEGIRLAMHGRVKDAIAERGLARSGIIILDALLKLRQACCDPRLLELPAAQKAEAGSAKLERLMELLESLADEGRRVLVFSQFTSMLALIEARLKAAGMDYVILTGSTKDRATPVERFQAGEVPIFLVSLKAGGVGLNLTAADTVIHYDPWWNPAAEDQATDRAHRIGQTKPVFVHRLMTLGSIEEKIEVLKDKKRALVATVLGGAQSGGAPLDEADIAALFGEV